MDKSTLNRAELRMIMNALVNEKASIKRMMDDLSRKGFGIGDQNVAMQERMHEIDNLISKLSA